MPCSASLDSAERMMEAPDPAERLVAHALTMIAGLVPAQITGWYPVTPRGENDSGSIALGRAATGVALDVVRGEYVLRYHVDDPFAPRRHLDSQSTVVAVADVGGSDGFARTDYARELMPELGVAHQCAIYLRDGGRMLGYLALLRTAGHGEFTEGDVTHLRRIHPFLQHAYNVARVAPTRLEHEHLLTSAGLTAREREVARLAAGGSTNGQIASALMVSEATVKTHLVRVFAKLDVRNRTELAVRLGPCRQDDPIH